MGEVIDLFHICVPVLKLPSVAPLLMCLAFVLAVVGSLLPEVGVFIRVTEKHQLSLQMDGKGKMWIAGKRTGNGIGMLLVD